MTHRTMYTRMFLFTATIVASVSAIDINITGTVKDSLTHKGVANATVALKAFPSVTTTTDASGNYNLSGSASAVLKTGKNSAIRNPIFTNNGITFSITEKSRSATVEVCKLDGTRVATLPDRTLEPGQYYINPSAAGLAAQLYFIKMRIGMQEFTFKYMQLDHAVLVNNKTANLQNEKTPATDAQVLSKLQSVSVIDTIMITAPRHKTLLAPISNYSGSVDFTVLSSVRQALPNIVSVSPKGINGMGLSKRIAASIFVEPNVNPGFINSGAPDSLRVQLKRIILKGDTALRLGTSIWEGTKTLTLTGKGTVDIGDMVLDSFPLWQVKSVELWFNDSATIWGSFTGIFNTDTTGTKFQGQTKTYYTKSAYPYSAATRTGGADSAFGRALAYETSPAESSFVSLAASTNGIAMVSTVDTFTYDTSAAQPTMTILFDLSRMLRFYNGCNISSVPPPGAEPTNKAYFFCHSVFLNSIATFFGRPGQIQGYQSLYNVNGRNEGVPGWMTLIWKSSGDLLSGILIGDDDNALCISKGRINDISKPDSTYSFHYDISNINLVGFKKCINLGDSTIGWWTQTATQQGGEDRSGAAKFKLQFKTN